MHAHVCVRAYAYIVMSCTVVCLFAVDPKTRKVIHRRYKSSMVNCSALFYAASTFILFYFYVFKHFFLLSFLFLTVGCSNLMFLKKFFLYFYVKSQTSWLLFVPTTVNKVGR